MKLNLLLVAAALLAAVGSANAQDNRPSGQPAVNAALLDRVNGAYIVKLKPGVQAASFVGDRRTTASTTPPRHTYDQGAFQGFAGKLSNEEVERLKQDPRVEYVERDQIVRINGNQANPPSWGLPRVSQHKLDLSASYNFPDTAGEGVEAWIIDTGVQANHTDFEGRATFAKSFVEGEEATDLQGHGTHVAGTIGSKTYGLAKKAKLFAVKVLNAQGSGTTADVVAGIQYVGKTARPGKSVVNMSLGGSQSKAIDDAVAAAVDAGVAFIVAAGNESSDACSGSPSGAAKAFAVAASDKTDTQASFSNFGKCVKVYGPGVGITSLWKGKDGATNTISGTSMASPHVAGVAALYLSTGSFSNVDALYKALADNATPGVIKNASANTPNKLIFNQASGSAPSPDPSPSPSPSPKPSPDPSPKPSPNPDWPFPDWPFPDWPFPDWPFPGGPGDEKAPGASKAPPAASRAAPPTATQK